MALKTAFGGSPARPQPLVPSPGRRLLCAGALGGWLVGLGGCASGLVFHSFSFDAIVESPGIAVLDYRYGASQQPGARATERDKNMKDIRQGVNINGDMLRGDELYVKWRINATQKVYEDTVNLKALLPRDIAHHRIHFTIQGQQLLVYLITPERRPADWPIAGPRMYDYLKVLTLSSNFGREVAP